MIYTSHQQLAPIDDLRSEWDKLMDDWENSAVRSEPRQRWISWLLKEDRWPLTVASVKLHYLWLILIGLLVEIPFEYAGEMKPETFGFGLQFFISCVWVENIAKELAQAISEEVLPESVSQTERAYSNSSATSCYSNGNSTNDLSTNIIETRLV